MDRLRRFRVAVPFDKILEAFEFVSFGPPEEHHAYLCLETGKIYWHSELGADEEELPEDIDDAEEYVAIPHKNDLDLGKNLAIDFIDEVLPDAIREVEGIFSRRGAHSNFKNLLERRGLLQRWYDYETAAGEKALRAWCADRSGATGQRCRNRDGNDRHQGRRESRRSCHAFCSSGQSSRQATLRAAGV